MVGGSVIGPPVHPDVTCFLLHLYVSRSGEHVTSQRLTREINPRIIDKRRIHKPKRALLTPAKSRPLSISSGSPQHTRRGAILVVGGVRHRRNCDFCLARYYCDHPEKHPNFTIDYSIRIVSPAIAVHKATRSTCSNKGTYQTVSALRKMSQSASLLVVQKQSP